MSDLATEVDIQAARLCDGLGDTDAVLVITTHTTGSELFHTWLAKGHFVNKRAGRGQQKRPVSLQRAGRLDRLRQLWPRCISKKR
jgi:hypothetical protein